MWLVYASWTIKNLIQSEPTKSVEVWIIIPVFSGLLDSQKLGLNAQTGQENFHSDQSEKFNPASVKVQGMAYA